MYASSSIASDVRKFFHPPDARKFFHPPDARKLRWKEGTFVRESGTSKACMSENPEVTKVFPQESLADSTGELGTFHRRVRYIPQETP